MCLFTIQILSDSLFCDLFYWFDIIFDMFNIPIGIQGAEFWPRKHGHFKKLCRIHVSVLDKYWRHHQKYTRAPKKVPLCCILLVSMQRRFQSSHWVSKIVDSHVTRTHHSNDTMTETRHLFCYILVYFGVSIECLIRVHGMYDTCPWSVGCVQHANVTFFECFVPSQPKRILSLQFCLFV